MNWRLLDIRVGRANRQQFCVAFLLSSLFSVLIFIFSPNMFSAIILILFLLYLLSIVALRRMHDLDILDEETDRVELDLDHIDWLLLIWLFFIPGCEFKNKYGYPPEGMNLNSMLAQDYSKKHKELQEEEKNYIIELEKQHCSTNEIMEIKSGGKTNDKRR